jgi:hypothetical protein
MALDCWGLSAMKTYTEAAARLGIAAVSRKIFDLTNLVFGSDK